MKGPILTRVGLGPRPRVTRRGKLVLGAPLIGLLAGCIQVSAPEKPIEINLNINIRQEVVVRLQQDVQDLIEENPGVF
jgi:hypothetical protein